MHRCLELARSGAANVAPNPMVGAVLVYNDRIIGEGYHQRYGEAHAEVNCIASVKEADRELISQSVLYVSLEPCAHFGKTPPCADLIIKYKIPVCIIGCLDPFSEVDGKGVDKLRRAGVKVEYGILEWECRELNKRFFTYHTKQRPYISLKWAQTADGFIASPAPERLLISNGYSNRLVHQWRSEEDAILIGTHTALMDDPALTTRLWPGHSPLRLVIDRDLKIPSSNKIFNKQAPTLIFNTIRHDESGQPAYYQVTQDANLVHQVNHALYQMKVQSVLVEGGARLLQSFIDEGMWDEARIITNTQLILGSAGLPAPVLTGAIKIKEMKLQNDLVQIFKPGKNTP